MTSPDVDVPSDDADLLPPFLLSIDLVGGRVWLHGDLDRRHVDRLLESVAVLAYSQAPVWSIDVAGVTFCDTAGLRALLEARRLAARAGRGLVVLRAGRWLRGLLDVAGLGSLPEAAAEPPAVQR